MSKEYDFLKECGAFFVLTINGDFPTGRPFGAIMEDGGFLYLATNAKNSAHTQMTENGHIQIVALKPGTREWIRITGLASLCNELDKKALMLKKCPRTQKHYSSPEDENFLLFKVEILTSEIK